MKALLRLVGWISDLRVAIVLLLVIASTSGVGTAIPQREPAELYHRLYDPQPWLGLLNADGVLALQLDHFDQIKNRWGLQASDRAVVDVAALLRSQQCEQDLVGQIGDQEFALLMVNVDLATAMERADAIRAGISELRGVFSASGHQLTASGGLTLLAPADRQPLDALLRAERALFLAQGNGKNQIAEILADPLEAQSALE